MKRACLFAMLTANLSAEKLTYPDSHPKPLSEKIHGIDVSDDYRWLEDLNSKQTAEWVKAQNTVTEGYLNKIPGRDKLEKHLTDIWNVERISAPSKKGGRYFFHRNDGLQDQSVFYTTKDLKRKPKVLFDPNKLSGDGTVALKDISISHNGKYMAYSLSASGSDWVEWKVRDIDTGKDLSDHLKWSKFSDATWSGDNKGFYYGRFPTPKKGEEMMAANTDKKIYYHKLGTAQSEDTLVYERPDHPKWGLYTGLTDDNRFLIIHISQGTDTKNGLFYKDLSKPDSKVIELFNKFDASYSLSGNIGSKFLIQTDRDAPRQKLVSVDLAKPEPSNWKTIIPQTAETLDGVSHVGGILIAEYMKDAHSQVRRFNVDGSPLPALELPGLGTAFSIGGKPEDKEFYYGFTSFTTPGTIYHYDIASNRSTLYRAPKTKFDPGKYQSSQIFATSKDGTKVPMFVVHKKGIKLDGSNPTYLYAYGGFNISLTPSYRASNIAWLDMGGIYVLANLRGGGEYGEEWHQAGMKTKKQNVFDDFIACAEHLIEKKYTSSPRLAIAGGSNGGLLVGACLTQRPDLYGACLPAVGVMDMLRFQKFTIGWAWQAEYGFPDKNVDEFKYLLGYSPYHNLKKGTKYPATMVTTSDHDDRVVPSHSFKFAAALQAAQAGDAPSLIRIETKAGHGAGTPTSKQIEQVVDKYSFLSKALGFGIKL
ncbi:MAG: prolyl oligopeptidase family serine peptidase [Akkermansiaceae bacterium]|nr:prolyl oligopeptidase family serine peptidase [Akkermansiaceae bacterium]MDG2324240.1 prolyl oligopeptidase family serine peptidase [Akkermansiaceae bacterium]